MRNKKFSFLKTKPWVPIQGLWSLSRDEILGITLNREISSARVYTLENIVEHLAASSLLFDILMIFNHECCTLLSYRWPWLTLCNSRSNEREKKITSRYYTKWSKLVVNSRKVLFRKTPPSVVSTFGTVQAAANLIFLFFDKNRSKSCRWCVDHDTGQIDPPCQGSGSIFYRTL